MSFVVIKSFTDLQDDNHIYQVGDVYPRKGRVAKKRVEELSTNGNRRGEIFIRGVKDDEQKVNTTKTGDT